MAIFLYQKLCEESDMMVNVHGLATANLEALMMILQDLIKGWPHADKACTQSSSIMSDLQQLILSSRIYSDIQEGKFDVEKHVVAPRTEMLLQILDQLQNELPHDAAVMVFTKTRASAVTLTEVINSHFNHPQAEAAAEHTPKTFRLVADYIIGSFTDNLECMLLNNFNMVLSFVIIRSW